MGFCCESSIRHLTWLNLDLRLITRGESIELPQFSIRGNALSLLRAGEINAIPKQEHTKGSSKADPLADVEIDGMTVEEIADQIGKTVRGVKTMLTRRGLQCADYNGAARKEIG